MSDRSEAVSFCPLCQATYHDSRLMYCRQDGAQLRSIQELGAQWIGRVIQDKYRIVRFLGEGGTAQVYEAEHIAIGRRVAVKLLLPQHASDHGSVERFRQEARLIALIHHPNVVSVEDVGMLPNGTLYMVMELLRGRSLEHVLDRGPIDPLFALDVALQTCEGLKAAHEKNIVHRDIKPANLFLEVDPDNPTRKMNVRILDLGIAKLLGPGSVSTLTMTGNIFGTPEYMSPQQATGDQVDQRSDIYSVGIVIYEMLIGRVPFTASSFLGVLTKHLTESAKWPEDIACERGLPDEAGAIVMRALEKNPEHRYASIEDLQEDLNTLKKKVSCRHQTGFSLTESPTIPRWASAPPISRLTGVHTVPLADATGTDHEAVEIAPDVYWVGRRQGGLLECNSYLRVYRGNGTQVNVLIDPGPMRDFEFILAKVGAVIGSPGRLDLIFLNHQDPDVAGNASAIQQLNPRVHVICSEDTWRLVQLDGLRAQNHSAVEDFKDYQTRLATGHLVQFVPTPFCHFRGAVMYYDIESRTLFSGDLFGGLSHSSSLVGTEELWPGMEIFHQLYMPSHKALQQAVKHIRQLEPSPLWIAPQHGGLVSKSNIPPLLARVENLRVGLDIMLDTESKPPYLAAVNALLTELSSMLGREHVASQLRRFAADGTFPNIFAFTPEPRILDFRVEPRAAILAFVRDIVASVDHSRRPVITRLVNSVMSRHHVRLFSAADSPRAVTTDIEE